MHFHIHHTTDYVYTAPATESFSELRLKPRETTRQTVRGYATSIQPSVPLESYVDYFGNLVETLAIPFRHQRLTVTSICEVTTHHGTDPLEGIEMTLSEAAHLFSRQRYDLHDYLRPSHHVPFAPELEDLARNLLNRRAPFPENILRINRHIHENFRYQSGVTDVTSSALEILEKREGVCQDFSHVMIGLLRMGGVPARYVSGYIESTPAGSDEDEPGPALVGAAASHAWVEVFTPANRWVGLDPTNNMLESEQHIQVAVGRDYQDVPPLKGVFKGTSTQRLAVEVQVQRKASG